MGKSPHRWENRRTDGKIAARGESWPARNGRLPARIEKPPHETENGRTNGRIAARKWKLSAQIGKSPARTDFSSHESIRASLPRLLRKRVRCEPGRTNQCPFDLRFS